MTRTYEEYKKLLKELQSGRIKDEKGFAKLMNLLLLEIMIDTREVLRDIRRYIGEK